MPNFKVQYSPTVAVVSHFCNTHPTRHLVPFLDQKCTVMSVGAQILLVVFDDDQLSVSDKAAPAVHNPSGFCRQHLLSQAS